MHKKRLLKLADLLEADAKNKKGIKFDLGVVLCSSGEDQPVDYQPAVNCGTTACAMGLAAVSGAFKRAGLGFYTEIVFDRYYGKERVDIEMVWDGARVDYIMAACNLFGIDQDTANFLFSPSNYGRNDPVGASGERKVAKRIRDLVDGKIAVPEFVED
jgi:hypothetical protein